MKQDITAQIRRLIAAFPQPPVSAETMAVYIDALSDMNPDALRQAVDVVIRSDDWFPKIKRLRTACEEFQFEQLSAATDRQWVLSYINGVGALRTRSGGPDHGGRDLRQRAEADGDRGAERRCVEAGWR